MKIYYVTGISTSGKSAVANEFTRRGYSAFDGDRGGITTWRHKLTGKEYRNSDLFEGEDANLSKEYEWVMSEKKVRELATIDDTGLIFICGTASNRYEIWSMFDKVFCLTIDEGTLRKRIKTRKNNKFGKHPKDLERILGWHKQSEKTDIEAGAIVIDATQSIGLVVDAILDSIK